MLLFIDLYICYNRKMTALEASCTMSNSSEKEPAALILFEPHMTGSESAHHLEIG